MHSHKGISRKQVNKELAAVLEFGLPWQIVTMDQALLRVNLKYFLGCRINNLMCVRLALPIPLILSFLPEDSACYALYDKGPSSSYLGGGGGGGQVSYTFPLHISITCKKGGREGVQIVCKIM